MRSKKGAEFTTTLIIVILILLATAVIVIAAFFPSFIDSLVQGRHVADIQEIKSDCSQACDQLEGNPAIRGDTNSMRIWINSGYCKDYDTAIGGNTQILNCWSPEINVFCSFTKTSATHTFNFNDETCDCLLEDTRCFATPIEAS